MKGQVTGIFFLFIVLLLLGSVVLWVMMAGSAAVTNALNNTHEVPSSTMANVRQIQSYYGLFNYFIPFLVNGAALATIVLGAFLASDPRYFSPGLIVLIVLVFISFYLSNIWISIAMQPAIIHYANQTNLILITIGYLPEEVLLWTGVYLVSVSLRKRQGD